jgi:hypothetical protein
MKLILPRKTLKWFSIVFVGIYFQISSYFYRQLLKMRPQDLPDLKDMPAVKGMPHGTAWGLWDKNGERDNCGSLNLLTPENTLEAQKEIRTGQGIALKYISLLTLPTSYISPPYSISYVN